METSESQPLLPVFICARCGLAVRTVRPVYSNKAEFGVCELCYAGQTASGEEQMRNQISKEENNAYRAILGAGLIGVGLVVIGFSAGWSLAGVLAAGILILSGMVVLIPNPFEVD